MAAVSLGDTVIIPACDRLSRDTADLLTIFRDLDKMGVGVKSIAESLIDTTSNFRDMVLAFMGVMAKMEVKRTCERTAIGRAAAKAAGVKFGATPKLTAHQIREATRRRDVDGEMLRSIGRSFNVSAQTIGRLRSEART